MTAGIYWVPAFPPFFLSSPNVPFHSPSFIPFFHFSTLHLLFLYFIPSPTPAPILLYKHLFLIFLLLWAPIFLLSSHFEIFFCFYLFFTQFLEQVWKNIRALFSFCSCLTLLFLYHTIISHLHPVSPQPRFWLSPFNNITQLKCT